MAEPVMITREGYEVWADEGGPPYATALWNQGASRDTASRLAQAFNKEEQEIAALERRAVRKRFFVVKAVTTRTEIPSA